MNAADAFDIGNFDDDDIRGIKVAEEDQKFYQKFNLVVSDRWQAEMMGGSLLLLVHTHTLYLCFAYTKPVHSSVYVVCFYIHCM